MEYKVLTAATDPSSIEGRIVTGLAAVMGNVDDGSDRIFNGAFKKTIKERAGRIKHLWMHDIFQPPTAVIVELKEVKRDELPKRLLDDETVTGGLRVKREYLDTPRADEILAGIKAGALTEMSFGYDPVKFDFEENKDTGGLIRNLRELRLWDTSDVTFGMNSLTQAAGKHAIPYKDTGKSDEDVSWSAPNLGDFTGDLWEDLSAGEKTRISNHYAYSTEWPAEAFASLKLPHHQGSTSGVGKAIWNGVKAAMGALLGARGGVDIASDARRSVYNHLAKHYDEFGKEPPEYKLIELSYLTSSLLQPESLKEGRVLSKRNMEKLKQALQTLSDILLAAEPPDDDEKVFTAFEEVQARILQAEIDVRSIY